jgi:hypothetical protein
MTQYQLLFDNSIPIANFSLPGDYPQLRGIEILNVPLGSAEFIQCKLENKMSEIKDDIAIIKSLKLLQQQWTYTYSFWKTHILLSVH